MEQVCLCRITPSYPAAAISSGRTLGIGSVALAWLLQRKGLLAKPVKPNLEAAAHVVAQAAASRPACQGDDILLHAGRPEQMDICDPKPQLDEWAGAISPKIKYDNAAQAGSKVLASKWKFKKHGQCGMDFSELVPARRGG